MQKANDTLPATNEEFLLMLGMLVILKGEEGGFMQKPERGRRPKSKK